MPRPPGAWNCKRSRVPEGGAPRCRVLKSHEAIKILLSLARILGWLIAIEKAAHGNWMLAPQETRTYTLVTGVTSQFRAKIDHPP